MPKNMQEIRLNRDETYKDVESTVFYMNRMYSHSMVVLASKYYITRSKVISLAHEVQSNDKLRRNKLQFAEEQISSLPVSIKPYRPPIPQR
jgi:hypothetical protein